MRATLANVGDISCIQDHRDVVGPPRQRISHLGLVPRTIVDASDARAMTTHVVEDGFDNVRQHAKLVSHDRCYGATEVMKSPLWQRLCYLIGPSTHSE